MGMTRIDSICAALLESLPAGTPAAVVQSAGTSDERRVLATLATLAVTAREAGLGSPAIILVGNAIGEAVVSIEQAAGPYAPEASSAVSEHARRYA
jgi:uroporphyrin-III C-methyltransferase